MQWKYTLELERNSTVVFKQNHLRDNNNNDITLITIFQGISVSNTMNI